MYFVACRLRLLRATASQEIEELPHELLKQCAILKAGADEAGAERMKTLGVSTMMDGIHFVPSRSNAIEMA